jgi:formate-dependent nitrite reductase membrane component NrfD
MGEVALQTHWGTPIALYLFLGGLAAGTLCVSALISIRAKCKFKATVRFGAWMGTLLLIVGVLCLLFEVTMPTRAILLWSSFVNPTSWMSIGAWLLVAGVIVGGLFSLANTEAISAKLGFLKKIQPVLAGAVILLGLGIALYTGILLGVLVAHPLWNTWLLPVLFTVSAMDTGVALVLGFAVLRGVGKPELKARSATAAESKIEVASVAEVDIDAAAVGELKAEPAVVSKPVPLVGVEGNEALDKLKSVLEKCTIVLVALEVVVLLVYLVTVSGTGTVAGLSVGLLTSGILAPWFWLLFVVCGLAVPLAVSLLAVFKRPVAVALPLTGAALCLVGGCTLRFLILLAGLPVHI